MPRSADSPESLRRLHDAGTALGRAIREAIDADGGRPYHRESHCTGLHKGAEGCACPACQALYPAPEDANAADGSPA